jgi:acetoin utilization deacetylase AcuC-like enzyme
MGFCLFNNVAIGAHVAISAGSVDRVLIVDWDVHHGNGTQDAFWTDEQVGFFSAHRWPFYPGTGGREETGGGKGLGTVLNLPLEFGITRKDYLAAFTRELTTLADRVKPQLVMISAGFDSHRLDPIGSLGLEVEDFVALTEVVLGVAREHAGDRIVSVLEGGYNLDVLPLCVAAHIETLLAAEATEQ